MKRLASILLISSLLLTLASCRSEESTTTVVSEDSTTETTTEATTTEYEPQETVQETTYIDGIGGVYVREDNYLSKEDSVILINRIFNFGYASLGVDNPKILEIAKDYFKDDSLTLKDVGFFQCNDLSDSDSDLIGTSDLFQKMKNHGFYLDFARYVLSLSGDRFMLRQIDNSFFRTYFPDFQAECDNGNALKMWDNFNENNPYFRDLRVSCANNGESELQAFLSKSISDPEARDAVRFYIFYALKEYDKAWFNFAGTYSTVIGFMPITYDIDGKITIVPSPIVFDQLQRRVNEMSKCENLDITKVETIDDLLNSGVNVDLLEQAFEYAGLDIPKLSEQYNQSSGV